MTAQSNRSDLFVPSDVVRLALGSVVPADARVLGGSVLLDQSMLTGELVAVEIAPEKTAYAGALVRRGVATAEITATGPRTYFGKTAELVRIAHAESGEQKAVFGVVRNLAVSKGAVVVLMVAYLRQSRQERLPDCPSQDLAVHTLRSRDQDLGSADRG